MSDALKEQQYKEPASKRIDRERRARKVSKEIAVAYHACKGLAELMSCILMDAGAIDPGEFPVLMNAGKHIMEAFHELDAIILDAGNRTGVAPAPSAIVPPPDGDTSGSHLKKSAP